MPNTTTKAKHSASSGSGRYHRPSLYPKQEAAIFNDARQAVVEASTKSGKTAGCMIWLFEQAIKGKVGHSYWWIAPVYSQAKIAYRRMRRGVPEAIAESNESELTLTLKNGAVIWFKGSDNPDSLYGEDVYASVVDEASRCKEEAWIALRSTLTATRGPVRIIGNVKGRKNWAYRVARRAESGEPGMSYAKITAFDAVEAGVLDLEEIEEARRDLPEHAFRELYLAEPSDDGANPFGIQAIQSCINDDGISDKEPMVWGWDLAKSVDWSVGIALDEDGAVCRFERFQRPWQETIAAILLNTNRISALVDSTGVGDPVLEALQRPYHSSGNIPESVELQYAGRNFEGYKFTQGSKQQLMEGLAVAIQRGAISYPEGTIVHELESFEYEYTRTGVRYSAPEGLYDDCVMALALAVVLYDRGKWRINTHAPLGVGNRPSYWLSAP